LNDYLFISSLQLESILQETGAINLFRFIVNPNDFAQSVENMFYLSFLIRDGKVAMETSEDGEPIICNHILSALLGFMTENSRQTHATNHQIKITLMD
jgi:hypothetical protein